jgi:hypothetical protein
MKIVDFNAALERCGLFLIRNVKTEYPIFSIDETSSGGVQRVFAPSLHRKKGMYYLLGLVGIVDIEFQKRYFNGNKLVIEIFARHLASFQEFIDFPYFYDEHSGEFNLWILKIRDFLDSFPNSYRSILDSMSDNSQRICLSEFVGDSAIAGEYMSYIKSKISPN